MRTRCYIIQTAEYGELRKMADSIAEARKWAKSALGITNKYATQPEITGRPCGNCLCRPCDCPRRPK